MKELFDQLQGVKSATNGRGTSPEENIRQLITAQMGQTMGDADGASRVIKADLYIASERGDFSNEQVQKILTLVQGGYVSSNFTWSTCLAVVIGNPDSCAKWAQSNGLDIHPPAIIGAVTQIKQLTQHLWEKTCSERAAAGTTSSTSILPNLYNDLYAKR